MSDSTLTDQVNTIERALGERMISHGMVILRKWAAELDMAVYIDRIDQLEQNYNQLFNYYLTMDDANRERLLDEMTAEAYRLEDEIYADIRIKRGLSPEMHGFNGDNPRSVMHYFASCVHFQTEDFDWIREAMTDSSKRSSALLAVASMSSNLRECFSEEAMLFLIETIRAEDDVIAGQALGSVILLLAHYDVRIDFFTAIQDAFAEAIGDGDVATETMCALIRSTKMNLRDMLATNEINADDMPDTLKEVLGVDEGTAAEDKLEAITSWMPESEKEYMAGIVDMFPDTWVYNVIVGDNNQHLRRLQYAYLSIGKMDLLWDQLDVAEQWLANRLMEKKPTPIDYINYAHCCFVRGDRLMAYENYREARSMCKSAKAFFTLFRPDRQRLVEAGIPIEQVYMMEDQLLNINR